MLEPPVLYQKWDWILESCVRYVRQVPEGGLEYEPPDRPRKLRNLAFHAMSIARSFLRAYDEGMPESWRGIMDLAPDHIQTVEELAAYGEESRRMLAEWWRDAGSQDPLLEWAVRESRCGLALLMDGSENGLKRLADGQAVAAGAHLIDAEIGRAHV